MNQTAVPNINKQQIKLLNKEIKLYLNQILYEEKAISYEMLTKARNIILKS